MSGSLWKLLFMYNWVAVAGRCIWNYCKLIIMVNYHATALQEPSTWKNQAHLSLSESKLDLINTWFKEISIMQ